jgi:hypothetical protein
MNDLVVEKLIQKVINLTEEVNDVNLVVRGITPPQAIVNKIHERIDVILASIQQIEKKLELDEERWLKGLENQTKLLNEEMEFRKSAILDVEDKIITNNEKLGQSFYGRFAQIDNNARSRFEEMKNTFRTTFWTQKWWLIVLSGVLFIIAIVVICMLRAAS